MKLYNTATRKVEELKPQNPPEVTVYTCGPTVYDYPHIGNWFTFIRYDLLISALKHDGYRPKWVMNITDVGHLVSDADEGEDKLEKGARREGKTAWDVAKFYSDYFTKALERVNMAKPGYLPKATDLIQEQIDLVKKLEEKGFTYVINDGVYFDTAKLNDYGKLARLDLYKLKEGARVEVNKQKKNPTDFAVWKFSPAGEKRDMEWWSPWIAPNNQSEEKNVVGLPRDTYASRVQGADEQRSESYSKYDERAAESATQQSAASDSGTVGSADSSDIAVSGSWGFPGWHLECSVMAMKYLGNTIDIHAGGIDHIPVHHTNEIAQSEAATGKTFSNYWMHANFILVDGKKMSKSLNNFYTLENIEKKGFDLQAFRLLVLESHYRTEANFTWEVLEAAQNRLNRWRSIAEMSWQVLQPHEFINKEKLPKSAEEFEILEAAHPHTKLGKEVLEEVSMAILDDLNTPMVLSQIDRMMDAIDQNGMSSFYLFHFTKLLQFISQVMGIDLFSKDISDEQKQLLKARQQARDNKDFEKSDKIRDQLKDQGIAVKDTNHGQIWSRT